MDQIGCDHLITKLDLLKGYWQVPKHLSSLDKVFKQLANASLTLILKKKCEFVKAVVTYLGKKVGQGQVKPVEAKVEAILKFLEW